MRELYRNRELGHRTCLDVELTMGYLPFVAAGLIKQDNPIAI
ncbi:hypothetical protein DGWBC_1591 [Dehalogenimonas sp. WBC-2]|nr:hypothetical protein DGWBC_1591 [Dehalogenimonas sp. WBC-2]